MNLIAENLQTIGPVFAAVWAVTIAATIASVIYIAFLLSLNRP